MAALDGDLQTGWSVSGREGKPSQAVWQLANPLNAKSLKLRLDFSRHYSASLGRFRIAVTTSKREAKAQDLPAEIEILLVKPEKELSKNDRAVMRNHYVKISKDMASARKPIEAIRKQFPKPFTTLVMQERETPRGAYVLYRGEYTQRRQQVEPGTPSALPVMAEDSSANRLGLARWLVNPEHPLTSRVVVNRFWQQLFGTGIVETSEDFGNQGQRPVHPELLDWLAVEFIESGWDIKGIMKLMLTSSTYRPVSYTHLRAHETLRYRGWGGGGVK